MKSLGFPNVAYFAKIYKEHYERLKDTPNITKEQLDEHIQIFVQKEARIICKVKKMVEPIIEEEFPNLVNDKVDNKWFLTIRPRDELNIVMFINFANKLFEKRIFKNAYWVYEQNGTNENELGKGKHFHAICEMNSSSKGKKYFLNEIQNFVKKEGLGDYIYDNCIDFKKIITDKDLHNKEEYIRTDRFSKSTDEKYLSWKYNNDWRRLHNIEPYYSTRGASPSNSPETP